ncbi:hypothetical protein [Campylobacter gastrosuis]|uniref:Phage morphogenesis protein n=1 Tax=Campylobacter gastrosuis TaxID=2974576 RepID=A0ABT7HSX9_9BACT|nr:hypothetical protein [Campylobacter gastrosuis]MDL0089949.1 hypothetical protein [Campylobacter gastrosuis]
MANFKDFERALSSQLRNALNRTLTKAKKQQIDLSLKYINVGKRYFEFSTSRSNATLDYLRIELRTRNVNIGLNRFKKDKPTRTGTIIQIGNKAVFFEGFGLNSNSTTGGRIIISSKNKPPLDWDTSEHSLKSSYKTKHGRKFTISRPAFIIHRLPESLPEYTLKSLDKLLRYSQDIFSQELEK